MIAQLTRNERQLAILISLVVAILGLMLGIAGRNAPIGLHGLLIFATGLLVIALIGRDYLAPEPSDERLTQYYDDPTRAGIVLAMIWVVFGLAIGDWVAWQLAYPDLTFGNVACPDHVRRARGARFTCTVQLPGTFLVVDATQTNDDGNVSLTTQQAVIPTQLLRQFVAFFFKIGVVSAVNHFVGVKQHVV